MLLCITQTICTHSSKNRLLFKINIWSFFLKSVYIFLKEETYLIWFIIDLSLRWDISCCRGLPNLCNQIVLTVEQLTDSFICDLKAA